MFEIKNEQDLEWIFFEQNASAVKMRNARHSFGIFPKKRKIKRY